MQKYDREAWVRFGRLVYTARRRRGYEDTKDWASAVGRSSRVLLGIERGEPAGPGTLELIERALKWPDQHSYAVLADAAFGDVTVPPKTVVPDAQDPDEMRFRRPENIGEEQWTQVRAHLSGYLAALLDQAARER